MRDRRSRNETGQLLPLLGFQILILMLVSALAIDLGYWRHHQRLEQTAVDSAAVAGAIELSYSTADADIYAAARQDVTTNGYTVDGQVVSLIAHKSPTSGPFAGRADAVEAILDRKEPIFFAIFPGLTNPDIAVRAVAILAGEHRNCIYALDPTGPGITIGGTTVNVPKCGLSSNSTMTYNGAVVNAYSLQAVGAIVSNGSTFGIASPTVGPLQQDPCPTLVGCKYFQDNPPNTTNCTSNNLNLSGQTTTLYPGVYCGGIKLAGSTVTFSPGLYVLTGALRDSLIANGSTLNGTGVTFYSTGGGIKVNGDSIHLTAPVSGPMQGMLFYQGPADTSLVDLTGSSGSTIGGGVYVPGSPVAINGSITSWPLIVAASVSVGGSGLSVTDNVFPGFRHVALGE